MKRALAVLFVLAAAPAAADPAAPAPAPHKRVVHHAPKPPPAEPPTITVSTEKPAPKVIIMHTSPRPRIPRNNLDDRLAGLPHHLQ